MDKDKKYTFFVEPYNNIIKPIEDDYNIKTETETESSIIYETLFGNVEIKKGPKSLVNYNTDLNIATTTTHNTDNTPWILKSKLRKKQQVNNMINQIDKEEVHKMINEIKK